MLSALALDIDNMTNCEYPSVENLQKSCTFFKINKYLLDWQLKYKINLYV